MFVAQQRIAGRYRLTGRIAVGGMGEVWRAQDERLRRDVAIKLLDARRADDERFRARFKAEARSAAGLQSDRVVDVYDWGEQADGDGGLLAYIAMELIDGRTIADVLADARALDPLGTAAMVADAGKGLAAAHARGLVHRDVKPANLLLTAEGRVKVADFGIARAADSVALTTTGMLLGTAAYISPEQVSGSVATAASDIYSLGVVAHQCLTGRQPFSADGEIATALARLSHPVPPLPSEVPPPLAELVTSMMAREPSERPSANAVADRARRIADDPVSTTAQRPGSAPTRELPAGEAVPTLARRAGMPWRDRRAGLLGALIVILAAAVAVPLLVLGSSSDGGAAPTPPKSQPAALHPRASPTARVSVARGPVGKARPHGRGAEQRRGRGPGPAHGHGPGHGPGPGHAPSPGHGRGRGHQHGPGGPPGR